MKAILYDRLNFVHSRGEWHAVIVEGPLVGKVICHHWEKYACQELARWHSRLRP